MTESSRPWTGITTGDAGPYSASNWWEAWQLLLGADRANAGALHLSADMPNDGLEVTQTSPVSSAVTLGIGAALIDGAFYYNTAALNLTIAANGSGNPRIDTVVLRKDYTLQTVRAAVLQGTPAASPVPPTLTQTVGVLYEIPLADIACANGFASIGNDNITLRHEYANTPGMLVLDGILNNSGITLETGDVVVWDTTTDRAVTTTTTFGLRTVAGVWQGRSANGAYGRVLTRGIGWVKVNGTVARGESLYTSTSAGQAQTRVGQSGNLGRVIMARTGAGKVLAFIDVRRPASDYVLIRDEKAQNTAGGTFTLGAWRTRDLNTEVVDTGSIASVAANQVTLEPGNYRTRWRAPGYLVGGHQTRLQNITAGTTLVVGSTARNQVSTPFTQTDSHGEGYFSLSVQSVLELQHQSTATEATNGFGIQANLTTEVYSMIEFWRDP